MHGYRSMGMCGYGMCTPRSLSKAEQLEILDEKEKAFKEALEEIKKMRDEIQSEKAAKAQK